MDRNWKHYGLWFSLALEILFLFLYFSLRLERIGSPLADVIWLLGGFLGIVFGIINLVASQKKYIKILSIVALVIGLLIIPLWLLAMFITAM